MLKQLPGTSQHQEILQSLIEHYSNDARILAVLLFGSLGRGNWDAYSDLDLDIIVKDDVQIDVTEELASLCAKFENVHGLEALIIPDIDEGDVVLSNLVELSIRYHPLNDTSPAISDSMVLLAGELSIDQVRVAAEARRAAHHSDATRIVNQCIRYALELHNAVKRERLWMALELLHRIRHLLMELFTTTHAGTRSLQFFEAHAPVELQNRLKNTVPHPEIASVEGALTEIIMLLEHELDNFSDGQYRLTDQQRLVLHQLNLRRSTQHE